MTIYVGAAAEIRIDAFDTDDLIVLTDLEIAVTVTIFDIDKTTVLVDEAPCTYDPTLAAWVYRWATPAVPGAYRARVTATAGLYSAREFTAIRVRQNKVPVP